MIPLAVRLESTAGVRATNTWVRTSSESGLEEARRWSALARGVAGAGGGRPGAVASNQTWTRTLLRLVTIFQI